MAVWKGMLAGLIYLLTEWACLGDVGEGGLIWVAHDIAPKGVEVLQTGGTPS